jgi:hypothetical protein
MQIASICVLTLERTSLVDVASVLAFNSFQSYPATLHFPSFSIFISFFCCTCGTCMHMHMHEHATSPPLLKQKFPILLVVPKRINTTHHPIRCMRSHLSLATYTPLSCHIYTYTCLCLSFSTLRVCLMLVTVSHDESVAYLCTACLRHHRMMSKFQPHSDFALSEPRVL